MMVVILDYGSGNIKSVYNSVKKTLQNFENKCHVKVSNNVFDLKNADKIILPGVGSFNQCMQNISKTNYLLETLTNEIINKQKPFLGICVGMQILANYGYEIKKTKGLSWISGNVKSLNNYVDNKKDIKIPHMGWNNLNIRNNSKIFQNINNIDQFYFVHSYFFDVKDNKNIICDTYYGIKIPAIIQKDNIFGFQFHPEKSGNSGLKILNNWLKIS